MTRASRSVFLAAATATVALACSGPSPADHLIGPPPNAPASPGNDPRDPRDPSDPSGPVRDGGAVPPPPTESSPVDVPQAMRRAGSPVIAQLTPDAGAGPTADVDAGPRDGGDAGIGDAGIGDAGIGALDAGLGQPRTGPLPEVVPPPLPAGPTPSPTGPNAPGTGDPPPPFTGPR